MEQKKNGFGRDAQMTRLQNYITFKEEKWWQYDETLIYEDLGVSGAKDEEDRPALKKLKHDIERWKIDVVLVWRIDRIARRTILLLDLVEFFNEHDVGFVSTEENLDTKSPNGKFFLTILGAFAEMERALIAEKTFMGKLEAAKKWIYSFGPSPYGYTKDPDSRILVINKDEAKIIRQIFEMYVSEKKSIEEIAKCLSSKGLDNNGTKKNGKQRKTYRQWKWRPKFVGDVLKNEAYIGKHFVNRYTLETDKNTGKKVTVQKDPSEWICIPTPEIIDKAVFNQSQARLEKNKYLYNNRNKPVREHLFRWLLKCEECGSNYKAYLGKKNGKGYVFYRCGRKGKLKFGGTQCTNHQISEAVLVKNIFAQVNGMINHPHELIDTHVKTSVDTAKITTWSHDIQSIQEQIREQNQQRDNVMELLITLDFKDENQKHKLIARYDDCENKIYNLWQRIEELKNYIGIEKDKLNRENDILVLSKMLQDVDIHTLEKEHQMSLLNLLIDKIVIGRDIVSTYFKLPNFQSLSGKTRNKSWLSRISWKSHPCKKEKLHSNVASEWDSSVSKNLVTALRSMVELERAVTFRHKPFKIAWEREKFGRAKSSSGS